MVGGAASLVGAAKLFRQEPPEQRELDRKVGWWWW